VVVMTIRMNLLGGIFIKFIIAFMAFLLPCIFLVDKGNNKWLFSAAFLTWAMIIVLIAQEFLYSTYPSIAFIVAILAIAWGGSAIIVIMDTA